MTEPLAGLDEAAVRDRVLRGEVNEVPQAAGRTVWQIVRANLFTPFNALLGTLFVVILVVGAPQDALFGVVLVANTAIGIFQELRAKRTLDRLAVLTAPRARVGQAAYAASLAGQAKRFTLVRSEFRAGINRILLYVTWAIVPTAALLFVSQFRIHDSWRGAVSGAVAGTVGMVPEGLVLLTSVAFAVAVVRLARKRVLVQELPAVEGLARVDVLCTDKTGTLTEGHLQVQDLVVLAAGVTEGELAEALGELA